MQLALDGISSLFKMDLFSKTSDNECSHIDHFCVNTGDDFYEVKPKYIYHFCRSLENTVNELAQKELLEPFHELSGLLKKLSSQVKDVQSKQTKLLQLLDSMKGDE